MVSANVLKIIGTILIFTVAVLAAFLPYKLRASKRILSIFNIFGGGIFLGAGLCHLLAEASEQFEELAEGEHAHDDTTPENSTQRMEMRSFDSNNNFSFHITHGLTHGDASKPYPWAFFTMGLGFLVTLVVEQVVHELTHARSAPTEQLNTGEKQDEFLQIVDNSTDLNGLMSTNTTKSNKNYGNEGLIGEDGDGTTALAPTEDMKYHNLDNNINNSINSPHNTPQDHNNHSHHDHFHEHSEGSDDHEHSHVPINTANQSMIVVMTLWLALSFHSVMEGIAFGSSKQFDSVTSILIAILAHKGLESFSLGTNLIKTGSTIKKYLIFTMAFALMTPLGILIGAIIAAETEGWASAFITAFAAGTFTYVAVVEVISPELKKRQDVWWKIAALALGFATMAILVKFV